VCSFIFVDIVCVQHEKVPRSLGRGAFPYMLTCALDSKVQFCNTLILKMKAERVPDYFVFFAAAVFGLAALASAFGAAAFLATAFFSGVVTAFP